MAMQRRDVVILGGGLAGLTLALQLRQRLPQLDVLVLERRREPAPASAFKVGESSVEIASHYFSAVLGLREHLDTCQLKKFGFRFFFSDGSADIAATTELGQSSFLPTPTWQIDRGIFENYLDGLVRAQGVQLESGAVVRQIGIAGDGEDHQVSYQQHGSTQTVQARWLVDASGRAGLLRRQLGMHKANEHNVNAAWFRVGARIDVGEWCTDEAWQERCNPRARWLSTNHLCGPGYWVWLIPLASGAHSIGIVADQATHPIESFDSFDKALQWLRRHQPLLAADLAGKQAQLQDFNVCRHFSHDCQQLFSPERWALTGEAGVFLDPFYSPGGDFIAIANTYITTLIARDLNGEPLSLYTRMYEQLFRSFYDSTLTLFVNQYPIFGDAEVMPVKVLWDYTYYWGVLCQLFFQQRLTDLSLLGALRSELLGCIALNAAMQPLLLRWSANNRPRNGARLLDQARLEWFVELNRGLEDRLQPDQVAARLRGNMALMSSLAREIVAAAQREHPRLEVLEVLRCAGTDVGAAAAPGALLFPA